MKKEKLHRTISLLWALAGALLILFVIGFFIFDYLMLSSGTRNPSSYARSDMRALATAIETYKIEYGQYPLESPMREYYTDHKTLVSARGMKKKMPNSGSKLNAGLTTPVAYISSIFTTPWLDLPYAYATNGEEYFLYCTGPDKDFDIQTPHDLFTEHSLETELLPYTYDPTNGMLSNGDIWRLNH